MLPSTQYPEFGLNGDAGFRWTYSLGPDSLPGRSRVSLRGYQAYDRLPLLPATSIYQLVA